MKCPICDSQHHSFLTKTLHFEERDFYQCHDCDFIFVPESFHLTSKAEKARYDLHQNHENDQKYHDYLKTLLSPLLPYLDSNIKNHLDFGCGNAQILKFIFDQSVIKSTFYDLYFYPQKEKLSTVYDIVTCIEVVEHFNHPLEDFSKLVSLVKKGGLLFVNTQFFQKEEQDFVSWWYKNDPTHISIFSPKTFLFLEDKFLLEKVYCDNVKTIIWRKK